MILFLRFLLVLQKKERRLPVEVGRASNSDQAVGVGELGEHADLVVVFKIRPHHRHCCVLI
jgi:hypothetical protein